MIRIGNRMINEDLIITAELERGRLIVTFADAREKWTFAGDEAQALWGVLCRHLRDALAEYVASQRNKKGA